MKKIILSLLLMVYLLPLYQKTLSAQQVQNIREEHKISADFIDADIRNVLTVLCTDTGYNLAFSEEINSKVSIKFDSVPVRAAIDAVIKACGFTYTVTENIINVTTTKQLKNLEEIKSLTKRTPETIPNVFTLTYINAEDIIPVIKTQLTKQGVVETMKQNENYSDTLVITDEPAAIEKVKYIIDSLDNKPKEIMIQTRIIALTQNDKKCIAKNDDIFHQLFTQHKNNPQLLQSKIIENNDLKDIISDLEIEGDVMLLLNSSLKTINNYTTDFSVENCFPQSDKNKKNALNLSFTPRITQDQNICLYIEPTIYEPTDKRGLNFAQKHRKQNFKTQMMLKSGETIIIAGFRKYLKSSEIIDKGLSGFATIPILGKFASKKIPTEITNEETTEVLILITPYIIKD